MGIIATNSYSMVESLSSSSSTSPHNRFHSSLISTRDFRSNCSGKNPPSGHTIILLDFIFFLAPGSLHDGHWIVEICSICPCSSLPLPFQFRRLSSRMFWIQTSRNITSYQVCPFSKKIQLQPGLFDQYNNIFLDG